MEKKEGIDIVEFLKARSHEIQAIEKSISVSHKQSLAWQRLPHYKRRRNRNFDKRSSKKFSFRPKDRHFLRTHTYYAKRFFMLKLQNYSIPLKRRLKSAKYIYKSQQRGFIFDESFRGAWTYDKTDFTKFIESVQTDNDAVEVYRKLLSSVDLNKRSVVQYIDTWFEIIIGAEEVVTVGLELPISSLSRHECCISVLSHADELVFRNSKEYQVYKAGGDSLETHKIICERSEIMMLYQSLINASLIPICLEEIHRLALEKNMRSIYDNVKTPLFRIIENGLVEKVIEKHNRTPPAKKVNYDLSKLYLQNERACRYFVFSIPRGTVDSAAEVFSGSTCIGRVVRGGYRFSSAKFCGLAFCYSDFVGEMGEMVCKNIKDKNTRLMNFISWV